MPFIGFENLALKYAIAAYKTVVTTKVVRIEIPLKIAGVYKDRKS
jgi:hypothetical protein